MGGPFLLCVRKKYGKNLKKQNLGLAKSGNM